MAVPGNAQGAVPLIAPVLPQLVALTTHRVVTVAIVQVIRIVIITTTRIVDTTIRVDGGVGRDVAELITFTFMHTQLLAPVGLLVGPELAPLVHRTDMAPSVTTFAVAMALPAVPVSVATALATATLVMLGVIVNTQLPTLVAVTDLSVQVDVDIIAPATVAGQAQIVLVAPPTTTQVDHAPHIALAAPHAAVMVLARAWVLAVATQGGVEVVVTLVLLTTTLRVSAMSTAIQEALAAVMALARVRVLAVAQPVGVALAAMPAPADIMARLVPPVPAAPVTHVQVMVPVPRASLVVALAAATLDTLEMPVSILMRSLAQHMARPKALDLVSAPLVTPVRIVTPVQAITTAIQRVATALLRPHAVVMVSVMAAVYVIATLASRERVATRVQQAISTILFVWPAPIL